ISALAALLLLALFYLRNRKALQLAHAMLTPDTIKEIERLHSEPLHAHLTRVGLAGFLCAVLLLVFHAPLSELTGLHITSAIAALVPAAISLFALRKFRVKDIILKVDSESILFFAGLFVIIGGLEKVNIFESLAESLAAASRTNPTGLVMLLHWAPGLASGVVDNVPLALAMSYVLGDLANQPGMPPLSLMVWSLALGVDIGGNLTPIGASANVVAYSYLERNHGKVGWKRWALTAVPPTLLAMMLATAFILFKDISGWY
ncbi:MAG: SLC13 family permease, partial [Anaerolineaceae bacterium]|nr:SLC13 family permease [Anaerolineaceae bacterium]